MTRVYERQVVPEPPFRTKPRFLSGCSPKFPGTRTSNPANRPWFPLGPGHERFDMSRVQRSSGQYPGGRIIGPEPNDRLRALRLAAGLKANCIGLDVGVRRFGHRRHRRRAVFAFCHRSQPAFISHQTISRLGMPGQCQSRYIDASSRRILRRSQTIIESPAPLMASSVESLLNVMDAGE